MTRALRAQIGALALACALPSAPFATRAAEVVSKGADMVAVTIYRDGPASAWSLMRRPAWMSPGGLVFVVETRTLSLPAGPSEIRFEGVSDEIVPQTAEVHGLPARAVERNFDYDLLTPGSLIAKSLGREVELIDTNRKTGKAVARRAVLRSGPHGVMLDVDGKVEAFRCDSVPERMVFDRIPDGLTDRPTLSVKVDAPKAGRFKVRLSYLATGISWASDYVARVRPDGRTLDLQGWITLANASTASFRDAHTQVVAGRVALTGDDRAVTISRIVRREQCWNRRPAWWTPTQSHDGATVSEVIVTGNRLVRSVTVHQPLAVPAPPPPPPMARQEDLGDYKLYTLPFPTTVAARQTKQVLFLSKAAVPFERAYRYTVAPLDQDRGPHETAVVLELKNTQAGGLGLPLPQGTVSIRESDAAGASIFTGEAKLDDTPKGLPVKLEAGRAPTVLASQRVVSLENLGGGLGGHRRVRVRYEISVVNGGSKPAKVEVVHPFEGQGFAVTAGSPRHSLDAGSPVWTLTIPAGGREVLSYGVEAERWRPR